MKQQGSIGREFVVAVLISIALVCVLLWATGIYAPMSNWHEANAWNALWWAFGFWAAMTFVESKTVSPERWRYPAAGYIVAYLMRLFYVEIGFPYVWIPWTVIIGFVLVGVAKELKLNFNFAYDMMGIRR